MTRVRTPRLGAAILLASATVLWGCGETPAAQRAADPYADAAQNIRLVGRNDLQGRESLVVVARSDAANGNWVYVGRHAHHPNVDKQNKRVYIGCRGAGHTASFDISNPGADRVRRGRRMRRPYLTTETLL